MTEEQLLKGKRIEYDMNLIKSDLMMIENMRKDKDSKIELSFKTNGGSSFVSLDCYTKKYILDCWKAMAEMKMEELKLKLKNI